MHFSDTVSARPSRLSRDSWPSSGPICDIAQGLLTNEEHETSLWTWLTRHVWQTVPAQEEPVSPVYY